MAITNFGYDGQISAVQFAGMMQHQGIVVPVVGGKDDFAVAANNSATLTCTVAPGVAYAPGVRTVSDSVISKTFDAVVTNGATRWDAVVLRRSWASGGSSSVEVVKGTASASAPAIMPAGVDLALDSSLDQVLALVQFTYGSTIPTAVVDRRAWAHPKYIVPSLAALPPAAANLYGMEAALTSGEAYRCLSDSGGTPAWVSDPPAVQALTSDSGFPSAAGNATTATVVIDRFTVPAAPSDRTIQLVSSAYVVVNPAGTQLNLVAYNSGAVIGYTRKSIDGTTVPDQMVVVGNGTIPANTSAVIEVRLSRQSTSGAFTSNASGGLTKTNLTLVKG